MAIAGQGGSPATVRRVGRSYSAVLWTFSAGLALLTFVNLEYWYLQPRANHLIGSPTPAQVTGTWEGDLGTNLVLRPDGTFTASPVPQDVGTAAPVTFNADGSQLNAWSGRGTWTIGPGTSKAPSGA
jgi:hypothetical protein